MPSCTFDLEFAREEDIFRRIPYSVCKSERFVIRHLSNFGTFIFLETSRFDFCIVGLIVVCVCV